MELKLIPNTLISLIFLLLIVPYGIETAITQMMSKGKISLLIVPYGIETL